VISFHNSAVIFSKNRFQISPYCYLRCSQWSQWPSMVLLLATASTWCEKQLQCPVVEESKLCHCRGLFQLLVPMVLYLWRAAMRAGRQIVQEKRFFERIPNTVCKQHQICPAVQSNTHTTCNKTTKCTYRVAYKTAGASQKTKQTKQRSATSKQLQRLTGKEMILRERQQLQTHENATEHQFDKSATDIQQHKN
jgi:hypothetical protein